MGTPKTALWGALKVQYGGHQDGTIGDPKKLSYGIPKTE